MRCISKVSATGPFANQAEGQLIRFCFCTRELLTITVLQMLPTRSPPVENMASKTNSRIRRQRSSNSTMHKACGDGSSRRRIARKGHRPSMSRYNPTFISCASLSILSILHKTHSQPVDSKRLFAAPRNWLANYVDTNTCYANLEAADTNNDGILSPTEFLTFVQLAAKGKLDTNEWGMPITSFDFLPQEIVSLYNAFACGNANVVCPSIPGINIEGLIEDAAGGSMTNQQEIYLYEICKAAEGATDTLPSKPPTPSPAIGSPISGVTNPPTLSVSVPPTITSNLPECPGLYNSVDPSSYGAGDLVSTQIRDKYLYYQCKPFPRSGWCGQAAYDPGDDSSNWEEAWSLIGECIPGEGGEPVTSPPPAGAATSPPSPGPTPSPIQPGTIGGSQIPTPFPAVDAGPAVPVVTTPSPTPEPSDSGTLFPGPTPKPQFPSYKPTDSDASSPTTSPARPTTIQPATPTTDLGEEEPYTGPLITKFEYEIYNTGNNDAESMMADEALMGVLTQSTTAFVEDVVVLTFGQASGNIIMNNGKVHSKEPDLKNIDQIGEKVFDRDDGAQSEEDVPSGKPIFDRDDNKRNLRSVQGRQRQLAVLLQPNAVSIEKIEDVDCSNQNSDPQSCQKVTASTELSLVNEPQNATALKYQNSINRALVDPGISFPELSGVTYAGPSSSKSNVVVIPGVKEPDEPPTSAPPEQETNGTPGWVVPVSIGAAAAGAVLLILIVGNQMNKRKRNGKEYEGYASSGNPEIEGDLEAGRRSSGEGSYEAELRMGGSPQKQGDKNPFLGGDDSSGSSSDEVSVGSWSRSDSSGSSSSTSSSTEDISHNHPVAQQQQQHPEGDNSYSLHTLHEVSEENLSHSGWSLMSGTTDDQSDKSVYRAGVEALVKEGKNLPAESSVIHRFFVLCFTNLMCAETLLACPEKYSQIDEMMLEYEGREEILIGHLSTMLAAKNKESASGTDTDTDTELDDSEQRESNLTDFSLSTNSSTYRSSESTDGLTLSTNSASLRSSYNPVYAEGGGDRSSPAEQGEGDAKKEKRASHVIQEAGGSASAAAALALFSTKSARADFDARSHSSSSDAGSSDWSSDDGLSSLDTSSFTTGSVMSDSEMQQAATAAQTLSSIGNASKVSQRVGGLRGNSNPMFVPVDNPATGDEDGNRVDETSAATKKDLDSAIQAGDWRAVGATAALIANVSPAKSGDDLHASTMSVTSHEKHQVQELEQLVEEGNWEAVMAAASRFESASEAGSLAGSLMESRQSLLDDSEHDSEHDQVDDLLSPHSSPESNGDAKIRAQIEQLVNEVVPDEAENVSEMMIQFRGREEELIETLETMKRQSESKKKSREEGIEELQRLSSSSGENDENDNGAYLKMSTDTNGEDNVSIFEGSATTSEANTSSDGNQRSSDSTDAESQQNEEDIR